MSPAIAIAEIVPEGSSGVARVEHFEVPKNQGIRALLRGEYVTPGRYARLYVGNTLMMSDTPMEHRTNSQIMQECNGDVFIAGLGIGMVLSAVLKHSEVRSVMIVEKYQDVIDLVAPHYSDKRLTITCADILEWHPPKGRKWDTIYFDIWPNICTDNLKDIAKLHRRFSSRLNRANPKAWMDSWQREALVAIRRTERRSDPYAYIEAAR
jgi:spermidine synthase